MTGRLNCSLLLLSLFPLLSSRYCQACCSLGCYKICDTLSGFKSPLSLFGKSQIIQKMSEYLHHIQPLQRIINISVIDSRTLMCSFSLLSCPCTRHTPHTHTLKNSREHSPAGVGSNRSRRGLDWVWNTLCDFETRKKHCGIAGVAGEREHLVEGSTFDV